MYVCGVCVCVCVCVCGVCVCVYVCVCVAMSHMPSMSLGLFLDLCRPLSLNAAHCDNLRTFKVALVLHCECPVRAAAAARRIQI